MDSSCGIGNVLLLDCHSNLIECLSFEMSIVCQIFLLRCNFSVSLDNTLHVFL